MQSEPYAVARPPVAHPWLVPEGGSRCALRLPGVRTALERLLDASSAEVDARLDLLIRLPTAARDSHSALNGDGCPVQLCVTLREASSKVRLLVDPTPFEEDAGRRRRHALATALRVLRASGSEPLADLGAALATQLAPAHLAGASEFRQGVAWVAEDLHGHGAALYLPTEALDRAAPWERLSRVAALTAAHESLEALKRLLAGRCELASVGLEGRTLADARLKLYWRMCTPLRLDQAGLRGPLPEAVLIFLRHSMAERELPTSGMVLGAGYSVLEGGHRGTKIDLCACPRCLRRDNSAWGEVIDRVAGDLGLEAGSLHALLRDPRLEVALVGLGLDAGGEPRLNVYLKERSP